MQCDMDEISAVNDQETPQHIDPGGAVVPAILEVMIEYLDASACAPQHGFHGPLRINPA
jgi:hypothetical protein